MTAAILLTSILLVLVGIRQMRPLIVARNPRAAVSLHWLFAMPLAFPLGTVLAIGAGVLWLFAAITPSSPAWHAYACAVLVVAGLACAAWGAIRWRRAMREPAAPLADVPPVDVTLLRAATSVWPWVMTGLVAIASIVGIAVVFELARQMKLVSESAGDALRTGQSPGSLIGELIRVVRLALWPPAETDAIDVHQIVWKSPRAVVLLLGALLVGWIGFHLHRRRTAALGFSQVKLVGPRGIAAWLASLPTALRVVAIGALAIALARPETYRTIKREVDSIDIVIVMDMSKSMEEMDMPRDRMDAAQRVIRRFLRRNKNDRIGLVIFGQQAMLQCPLTHDSKMLEKIVADLVIGDVPELGTAIGDGLALGLAQLRRSDAKSKVVILLSDGDSNWVTRFAPDEAARVAQQLGVKVYTLLVGREESDLFGGMSVNPATLRNIATVTGGEFFRASDYESFDRGFQTVRTKLDTSKRTVIEKVPDKQLFVPLALLAAVLIALAQLLEYTRLRRLP